MRKGNRQLRPWLIDNPKLRVRQVVINETITKQIIVRAEVNT